jgi:hypothetical protein
MSSTERATNIQKRIEEFKSKRKLTSSKIEYTLVENDVFRINIDSMKRNRTVRAQINASKSKAMA